MQWQAPAGFEGDFMWPDYLKTTKSEAAPMVLFSHKLECKHGFKVIFQVVSSAQEYVWVGDVMNVLII